MISRAREALGADVSRHRRGRRAFGGTVSSNPAPSSGESRANPSSSIRRRFDRSSRSAAGPDLARRASDAANKNGSLGGEGRSPSTGHGGIWDMKEQRA